MASPAIDEAALVMPAGSGRTALDRAPGGLIGVITTVQPPTEAVSRVSDQLARVGGSLIIVGDVSGPDEYQLPEVEFLPLQRQLDSKVRLAQALPVAHYARKNLGYLRAMSRGADCIYETDDDNVPTSAWRPRELIAEAATVSTPGWFNVFHAFTDAVVWPRGFPVGEVLRDEWRRKDRSQDLVSRAAAIQQGLADGAADVDALWRLAEGFDISFRQGPSLRLGPGVWCPFNSQSTWWWRTAFALMYLPTTCSFRLTDIYRSYVAQRCLWELGQGVVFHGPEVLQRRNPHDVVDDLRAELPGYLAGTAIAERLSSLRLQQGQDAVGDNLRACYGELARLGLVSESELACLDLWLADLQEALQDRGGETH